MLITRNMSYCMENNIQTRNLNCLCPKYLDWRRECCLWYQLIPMHRYWTTAYLFFISASSVKPSLTHLVYLKSPLPVLALSSATAALQSSGTAALSLFRVPRTNTASTWDMTRAWASECCKSYNTRMHMLHSYTYMCLIIEFDMLLY